MTIKLTKAAALAPLKAAQGRSAAGRRPARRLRWIVGPAAALVVLAAGAIPAVAAGTSTPVVYYACVTNATGAIKIVHASTACATGQHKISWNNRGPAGFDDRAQDAADRNEPQYPYDTTPSSPHAPGCPPPDL
jgi:hypothetical protein